MSGKEDHSRRCHSKSTTMARSHKAKVMRRWPLSSKENSSYDERHGEEKSPKGDCAGACDAAISHSVAAIAKQHAKAKLKKTKVKSSVFKVAIPKPLPQDLQEHQETLRSQASGVDPLQYSVPSGVTNIDQRGNFDFDSPAYAQGIVTYLMERELHFCKMLPPTLLHKNANVKLSSRAVLVDWLIQVQDHLELTTESLHLAVGMLDQMLAARPIELLKVQLIGITCLLLACKIIERFPPTMNDLLRLTEFAYTPAEMKTAERLILRTMGFDMILPTPVAFLDRWIQASKAEVTEPKLLEIQNMASYLLELAFTDARLMVRSPSSRASGALWLSRRLLLPIGVATWSKSLAFYTKRQEKALVHIVSRLSGLLLKVMKGSNYKGAYNKFKGNSTYGAISIHPSLANTSLLSRLALGNDGSLGARGPDGFPVASTSRLQTDTTHQPMEQD